LTDLTGHVLKIADFGAAARIADLYKFCCLAGTYPYMAPEVVRAKEGRRYGPKCDVWSVGCVVIEMATTRPPWVLENQQNNRWEILYRVSTYSKQDP
jgi:mitogen-activated protein kinase kinase kinase 1